MCSGIKSMGLKEYIFGYVDAEKEFTYKPAIIENAFYDPHNYIEKLINDIEFMLIGRKGVGKTAYSAKIRKNATMPNASLHAQQINLSKFNFDEFYKIKNEDYEGSRKFKGAWDLCFLVEIIIFLNKKVDYKENEAFNNCILNLKNNGLLYTGESLNAIVTEIASKELNFSFKSIGARQTYVNKTVTTNKSQIIEYFKDVLREIYYSDDRFIIILDGLDDILRFNNYKVEILSGLIRSLDDINNTFAEEKIPIKIILLIREDILSLIHDPDFTKIKSDGGLVINWDKPNDLKEFVSLRFKLSGFLEEEKDFKNSHWYNLFPEKIDGIDSWKYIIGRTLKKPRDIIKFMLICQQNFPDSNKLTENNIKYIVDIYSKDYFLSEMESTISGFFEDDIVKQVYNILKSIGDIDFSVTTFFNKLKSKCPEIKRSAAEEIIFILFNEGYLGQIVRREMYAKKKRPYMEFKYKNHTLTFDANAKYHVHYGLYSAFGFNKK